MKENNLLEKEIHQDIKYESLYSTNKENISEFNKSLYFKVLENVQKHNQDIDLVTEKIIDNIWEQQYSKYDNQQKSIEFLRKFNKCKDSEIYKIILHLHKVIGIKNIDLIGKEVNCLNSEYSHYLNHTLTYLEKLKDFYYLDNIMDATYFNSLLTKKTIIKYINKVKANRIYRHSALVSKKNCNLNLESKSSNINDSKKDLNNDFGFLKFSTFFPIIEVYLTKIKIKKIHNDIKPLLKALDEFKYKSKKTSYSSMLVDEKLTSHYKFVNIFPERDTNLYLVLIFSIYLKVPYNDTRKLLALLLGYEIKGGFANRTNLAKRFKDLENLELMMEYIDNQ